MVNEAVLATLPRVTASFSLGLQGELLPQEQMLSGQSRTRTEAKTQEAQDIQKQRAQRTSQRDDRMDEA